MTGFPGIGLGVDVHKFGGDGPLRIGGVEVEHHQGLLGHSDADVLCHAVADAILGAAGLGDLGEHFPSDDPQWKGVSSLHLLELVAAMLPPRGLAIEGVDGTVMAETPRLGPYRRAMAVAVAEALECPVELVSVKVKSSDGLGLIGRREGVVALAVARIGRPEPMTSPYH